MFWQTSVFCAKCSSFKCACTKRRSVCWILLFAKSKNDSGSVFMDHVVSTTEIETFALRSVMTTISAHRWERFCLCVMSHYVCVRVCDILTHQTDIVTWILLDLPVADGICQTRMSTVTVSDLTQIRCVLLTHIIYITFTLTCVGLVYIICKKLSW